MKIPQFVKQIIDQKTEALRKNGIEEKQDRNTQLETITKAMTKENNSNSLQPTLPLLSAVFVTMFIAAAARIYIIRTTADRITAGLRARLYKTILNRELKFFEKNTGGEISSRLNTDVQILANAVTGNLGDGLRYALTFGIGGYSMYAISATLTGAIACILPVIGFGVMSFGRYLKRLSEATQSALALSTKISQERLGNIRTVKAFANEEREATLYRNKVNAVLAIARKENLSNGTFYGGISLIGNGALLTVMYYGGDLVSTGLLTIGDLTSFLLYTVYVGGASIGLSSFYSKLMKGVGASTRVLELLNENDDSPLLGKKIIPPDRLKGNITFKNIQFAYPSRPTTLLFDDLTLTIKAGTHAAICGQSGVGKSTLAAILLAFYPVQKGGVIIDGHNLADLDISWFRRQVGYVPQEPILFEDTIEANIKYGNPEATRADVERACERAHCIDFIKSLPAGFETLVGERGVQISGGQRQRIAIARALLSDPKILVLDEATSALSNLDESLVQAALESASQGRTVMTIAHRLTTIAKADVIMVMQNGSIVQSGTYNDLLSRAGPFKEIAAERML